MTKKGIRTAKLNVLLVKSTYKTFEDALRDDHSLSKVRLKQKIGNGSALYAKKPHQNPPSWAKFLVPIAAETLQLANASSSAVLFVKSGKRILAFCFGQGRSELKPEVAEPGFGLKVALNTVDPERLRSADARTLEHGITTKRLQTSRDADQTAFGFDVSRDLLRQIAGQPDDASFAGKVIGSDSLTVHAQVVAADLGKKSEQLLKAFRSKRYKDFFEWVDHLAAVTDPTLSEKLDGKLISALKGNDRENMHLAASSVIDWEAVDKFKIQGAGRDEFLDLDLEAYIESLGDNLSAITVAKLKGYRIRTQFAGSDSFVPQGSVYSSLVWETKYRGRLYALVDGHWYSIDESYAAKVAKFIKKIPEPDPDHLPTSTIGEKEGDYNERAANDSDELFLFDKVGIRPDGAATPIEFCDLFSKSKQMIHVKRKTRSATLSHLFAQGAVSAQLFLQDPEVRKQVKEEIREKLPSGGFLRHIPDGRPAAADYEVVFAIIAKPQTKWPLSLPFFSQVNLMTTCKQLEALDYRYALQLVEVMEDDIE